MVDGKGFGATHTEQTRSRQAKAADIEFEYIMQGMQGPGGILPADPATEGLIATGEQQRIDVLTLISNLRRGTGAFGEEKRIAWTVEQRKTFNLLQSFLARPENYFKVESALKKSLPSDTYTAAQLNRILEENGAGTSLEANEVGGFFGWVENLAGIDTPLRKLSRALRGGNGNQPGLAFKSPNFDLVMQKLKAEVLTYEGDFELQQDVVSHYLDNDGLNLTVLVQRTINDEEKKYFNEAYGVILESVKQGRDDPGVGVYEKEELTILLENLESSKEARLEAYLTKIRAGELTPTGNLTSTLVENPLNSTVTKYVRGEMSSWWTDDGGWLGKRTLDRSFESSSRQIDAFMDSYTSDLKNGEDAFKRVTDTMTQLTSLIDALGTHGSVQALAENMRKELETFDSEMASDYRAHLRDSRRNGTPALSVSQFTDNQIAKKLRDIIQAEISRDGSEFHETMTQEHQTAWDSLKDPNNPFHNDPSQFHGFLKLVSDSSTQRGQNPVVNAQRMAKLEEEHSKLTGLPQNSADRFDLTRAKAYAMDNPTIGIADVLNQMRMIHQATAKEQSTIANFRKRFGEGGTRSGEYMNPTVSELTSAILLWKNEGGSASETTLEQALESVTQDRINGTNFVRDRNQEFTYLRHTLSLSSKVVNFVFAAVDADETGELTARGEGKRWAKIIEDLRKIKGDSDAPEVHFGTAADLLESVGWDPDKAKTEWTLKSESWLDPEEAKRQADLFELYGFTPGQIARIYAQNRTAANPGPSKIDSLAEALSRDLATVQKQIADAAAKTGVNIEDIGTAAQFLAGAEWSTVKASIQVNNIANELKQRAADKAAAAKLSEAERKKQEAERKKKEEEDRKRREEEERRRREAALGHAVAKISEHQLRVTSYGTRVENVMPLGINVDKVGADGVPFSEKYPDLYDFIVNEEKNQIFTMAVAHQLLEASPVIRPELFTTIDRDTGERRAMTAAEIIADIHGRQPSVGDPLRNFALTAVGLAGQKQEILEAQQARLMPRAEMAAMTARADVAATDPTAAPVDPTAATQAEFESLRRDEDAGLKPFPSAEELEISIARQYGLGEEDPDETMEDFERRKPDTRGARLSALDRAQQLQARIAEEEGKTAIQQEQQQAAAQQQAQQQQAQPPEPGSEVRASTPLIQRR
tara:strand:+ start:678 stop:4151 length:3474 start_codon:yes stop_codon:yes gene_type:complete